MVAPKPPTVAITDMPLRAGDWHVLAAGSMEQIIGAAVATVAGVMIPMMQLVMHPELSTLVQGLLGASDLIGIAVGSTLIGSVANRQGYLGWFRACPLIIIAACALVWLVPQVWATLIGLFFVGVGVGGGYSLDSAYISEIMPQRWRLVMVGIAKATCSVGFLLAAVACLLILHGHPSAAIWNWLILVIAALAAMAFLLRMRFAESPLWLLERGERAQAQRAAQKLLGPDVVVPVSALPPAKGPAPSISQMLRGESLRRVILTGIPWACEGVGVYGVGVFLPMLIMALGIDGSAEAAQGIHKVIGSVEMTAVVNFFTIPGFVLGLLLMRRWNHVSMLAWGFVACAVGLVLLWIAYHWHLPLWTSVVGFLIFEVFLSGGPHLITFVLPAQVFPVDARSVGSGLAATLGKVGAILGVFFMPVLLHGAGISAVLWVCVAVNILGAFIAKIYARKCGL